MLLSSFIGNSFGKVLVDAHVHVPWLVESDLISAQC
jgi:hypothetical protein